MDEIMNKDFPDWWNPTFTGGTCDWTCSGGTALDVTSTTASDTTSILNFVGPSTWSVLVNLDEWPKGVSDQSFEKKYTPKWHILQGYKNQMKSMWD